MSAAVDTGQPQGRRSTLVVGLVLLLVGLPMLGWGAWYLAQAVASGSWPSVEGRVTRVAVRRDTRGTGSSRTVHYRYIVHYRYEVAGAAYTSNKYALGSGDTAGRAPTHADAGREGRARFPVGARVTVHHDPDDPATAVLRPGAGAASWGVYVPTVLGLLFAGLGAWLLVRIRRGTP